MEYLTLTHIGILAAIVVCGAAVLIGILNMKKIAELENELGNIKARGLAGSDAKPKRKRAVSRPKSAPTSVKEQATPPAPKAAAPEPAAPTPAPAAAPAATPTPAPAAALPPAPAPTPAGSEYEIVVQAIGTQHSEVLRITRNAGRIDHADAARLLQALPVTVRKGVTKEIAQHFKDKYTEAGATVIVQPVGTTPASKSGAPAQPAAAAPTQHRDPGLFQGAASQLGALADATVKDLGTAADSVFSPPPPTPSGPGGFVITLEAVGDRPSEVIRVTRNAARTDHHGAKRLHQSLPAIIRRGVTKDIATHFQGKYAEAGARATIHSADAPPTSSV